MAHDADARKHRSTRSARGLAVVAAVWATAVTIVLVFAPLATSETTSSTTNGDHEVTSTARESLLDREGPLIVATLAAVAAVTLAAALLRGTAARRIRVGAGMVIALFSVIGAASIGLFYMPAALLLIVAGTVTPATRESPRDDLHGVAVDRGPVERTT